MKKMTAHSEISNRDRVEWAAIGVNAYAAEVFMGQEFEEVVIQDFLTDLMHFCESNGFDFADICAKAEGNYRVEKEQAGL
jgi:hypothetical protein